nr:heterogeneous nuclear ribonucleoprotein L-like [Leptinotarsa decemlineata]
MTRYVEVCTDTCCRESSSLLLPLVSGVVPPRDPYPSEPTRTYDEICATTGFPETFATDAFRKGATPAAVTTDQRNAQFQQPGGVLMVYGLDPLRTNADKLFNLMCLYGNVARIKFLKSKEGTAMVQMGDSVAVERCVQNLNNVVIGITGAIPLTHRSNNINEQQLLDEENAKEHKLQLAFSKQPFLSEVTNPYPLPDKSPSYKLYINNKNNRFMNPAMASKNRIQPPSKVILWGYDVVPPKAVKLFPMKSERSSSGLLEFENTTEAVAAVMACNHAAIESPGMKFPFIMKLCFSSSRSMTIRNGDNNSNEPGEKMQEH